MLEINALCKRRHNSLGLLDVNTSTNLALLLCIFATSSIFRLAQIYGDL